MEYRKVASTELSSKIAHFQASSQGSLPMILFLLGLPLIHRYVIPWEIANSPAIELNALSAWVITLLILGACIAVFWSECSFWFMRNVWGYGLLARLSPDGYRFEFYIVERRQKILMNEVYPQQFLLALGGWRQRSKILSLKGNHWIVESFQISDDSPLRITICDQHGSRLCLSLEKAFRAIIAYEKERCTVLEELVLPDELALTSLPSISDEAERNLH